MLDQPPWFRVKPPRNVPSINVWGPRGGKPVAETGPEGARTFAERVLKRVDSHEFGDAGRPVHVTLSIGVACYPLAGITDGEELLRLADQNLYRAKMEGRNRFRE